MHFLGFTLVQILWTLTFAALLVLLVVLMGRDRVRRFPWFTTGIVLTALRLLTSRMLFGRMAPITLSSIFLTLAVIEGLVSLLVLVEIARRAFSGASRRAWLIGTLSVLAVGAAVLATWGNWPALKSLSASSLLGVLGILQLTAQKLSLLADVLTVELGLLVVLFGRRFKAGWRSHTQQIVIGLSTASIAQMASRGIWQLIALHAAPQTQAEYERVMSLQEKLYNATSVTFLVVLVWWIACLWINEPGTESPAKVPTLKVKESSKPSEVQSEEGN